MPPPFLLHPAHHTNSSSSQPPSETIILLSRIQPFLILDTEINHHRKHYNTSVPYRPVLIVHHPQLSGSQHPPHLPPHIHRPYLQLE